MSKSMLAGHSFVMSLGLKRGGMLPGKHHYSEQAQNANDNEVQVDQGSVQPENCACCHSWPCSNRHFLLILNIYQYKTYNNLIEASSPSSSARLLSELSFEWFPLVNRIRPVMDVSITETHVSLPCN